MIERSRLLSLDKVGPFIAWTALIVFVVWGARDLDFGSFAKPGPALFPVLLSVVIGVLAVGDLVLPGDRRPQGNPDPDAEGRRQLKRSLVIVCVILFAILLPFLGTVLVSALMMAFLLIVVERQPVAESLALSLGTSVGMYLLLATALGLPLPNGLLEVLF